MAETIPTPPHNRKPDTSLRAVPDKVGGDRTAHMDVNIVPGEGVYLSRSQMHEFEREASKAFQGEPANSRRTPWGNPQEEYAQALIAEDTIIAWHNLITKGRNMDAEKDRRVKYEAGCHPGTDTKNPDLQASPHRERSNSLWLDKSESTIVISSSQSSGQTFNGSAVEHNHFIHVQLTTPDGRFYGDFRMTYDQFAQALVAPAHTPITWDSYWDVNDRNVMLREVVHTPDPIKDRMKQRIVQRLDEVSTRAGELLSKVAANEKSGKPMGVKAQKELCRELENLISNLKSNTGFALEQAVQEASSVVEQAAIAVMAMHSVAPEDRRQVLAHTPLAQLLPADPRDPTRPPVVALPPPVPAGQDQGWRPGRRRKG